MIPMQKQKEKSTDRVIVLKQREGAKSVSSTGLVDNRLFKGGNALHAIMGPTGIWTMKYENGALPEPLRQSFTNFDYLLKHARTYFSNRGIDIVEVVD